MATHAPSTLNEDTKSPFKQAASEAKDNPTPKGFMGVIEEMPATTYLYGSLGSIGLSLVLRLLGKKEFANFVGLWPPTIMVLAMLNKQLRPSREM